MVTPADAVIAPLHERDWYVLSSQNVGALFGGSGVGVPLGHGPLLDNTLAWVRMAKMIGPQEPRDRTPGSGVSPCWRRLFLRVDFRGGRLRQHVERAFMQSACSAPSLVACSAGR